MVIDKCCHNNEFGLLSDSETKIKQKKNALLIVVILGAGNRLTKETRTTAYSHAKTEQHFKLFNAYLFILFVLWVGMQISDNGWLMGMPLLFQI